MSRTLSAEQLSDYKDVFAMFDKDGDGTVDASELGEVLAGLGVNPTPAELETMILEVDTDGSGSIEFNEFCVMMAGKAPTGDSAKDEMREVFDTIDQDKDGLISVEDLEGAMGEIQWGQEKLRDDDATNMITLCDTTKQGKLTFKDFCAVIQLS